ncbi:MAG TPA: DUF6798 domain-containing protein [Vicinamibacteria bacterium]
MTPPAADEAAVTPGPPAVAAPRRPAVLRLAEGAVLFLLLALAGTVLNGYRYGDSNHGITVPMMKRVGDPSLYSSDIVVATAERYPTLLYSALARVLPGGEAVPLAFFVLFVVSMAAVFGAVYRLGRAFGGESVGLLAVAAAFPVRIGLAGSILYRVLFSHGDVATAVCLWALVFFVEGRRVLPLLLLSLSAYNHLLYSAYLLVPLTLVVLWESRAVGARRTLRVLAAAVLPLLPLAAWFLSHRAPLTAEWLDLLQRRSAHHSFPSAFAEQYADAVFLLALAAFALPRLRPARRAFVLLFAAGVGLLFALGWLFSEWHPVKAVLQLQPFRAWRYAGLLAHVLIAADVVQGFRHGGWARVLAPPVALIAFAPGLEPLLPLAVALRAAATAWPAALGLRLLGVASLLAFGGWGTGRPDLAVFADYLSRVVTSTVVRTLALAALVWVARPRGLRAHAVATAAAGALAVFWVAPDAWSRARARWEADPWYDVQRWVRQSTPTSAIVLTPPEETGFRVFSERTVVGEWKDGTQQYFDEAFVREWGERMTALGRERFPLHSDATLLELARRYGAGYVVLPAKPPRPGLELAYRNREYAVYRAVPASSPEGTPSGPRS